MKTISIFIFNLSARILFTIISVLSGFFLVRYLGPVQYGVIGIYTTLLQFVPGFICFSFFDSYGKEFAQKGLTPHLFSESLITITAGAIICIALVLGSVSFLNKTLDFSLQFDIYVILSIHFIFYLINAMYERAMEAVGKSQIISTVQFLTGFITIISVVYVILFKEGIYPYLIGQVLISVVSLLAYILYSKKANIIKSYVFSFDFKNFKNVLKYTYSIYIAQLYSQVTQRLPVFITQKLYGLAFVSYLNVPLNLFGRLYLPSFSLSTVLSPKFSTGDFKTNLRNFEYGIRLILLIFIPATTFFLGGSQKLIPLLYGSKFSEAIIPTVILAPFLLFFALDIFLNSIINYLGLAGQRLKYIKFAGLIDIIALVAGTYFLGFYGLLSSFPISIMSLALIDFYIIKRKIEIPYKIIINDVVKISVCSIPIFLFCLLFSGLSNLLYLAGCCLASLCYILFIFVIRVISKDDLLNLFGSFRNKGEK